MADIKDEKLPYEILIRYRDGVFAGAHIQYIRRVTLGDEVLKNEEMPAEPLTTADFPTSAIMTSAARDAIIAANAALSENESLKSTVNELTEKLERASLEIGGLLDQLAASKSISDQAYLARDVA